MNFADLRVEMRVLARLESIPCSDSNQIFTGKFEDRWYPGVITGILTDNYPLCLLVRLDDDPPGLGVREILPANIEPLNS
jgi:hypothetical protein